MEQRTTKIVSNYDNLPLSVLWIEPEEEIKGVVQISHGMAEHKERYLPFMEYLAGHGYAAVIHDHRGHGESVLSKEELGYFYGGREEAIVKDLHQITQWAKNQFPEVPFYLLGHSMGTLVARNYIKNYDYELDKLILTGPPCKNPVVDMGLGLVRLQKKWKGDKYRSKEIQAMAFGPYAAKFRKEEVTAWICSNADVVEAYNASELCGFIFTTDGFEGLLLLLKGAYSKKGWKLQNKGLPILFLGGEADPCIGGGRRFVQELQFLKKMGYQNVTGKMYPHMRHEILNEVGKETVFDNILSYLKKGRQ